MKKLKIPGAKFGATFFTAEMTKMRANEGGGGSGGVTMRKADGTITDPTDLDIDSGSATDAIAGHSPQAPQGTTFA